MTDKFPRTITTAELRLGDTVCRMVSAMDKDRFGIDPDRSPDALGPWGTTLVVQIQDGLVHMWRPYGTTADFSYTGGVIPFIGIETYSRQQDDGGEWLLYRRQTLK